MGPRRTGNRAKDYIAQLKYDLQTKGGLAVIDRIRPLLSEIFLYQEKQESLLKPGESSKMLKLANVTSNQLIKVDRKLSEGYREIIEPEIKETIEHNILQYLEGNEIDDYILIIKEKLSEVKVIDEDNFSGIKSVAVRDTLSSIVLEEQKKHKKRKFKVGESVQIIKLDLERVDARLNEYAEMLARLNIIDEETVQKINSMLKSPTQKKESGEASNQITEKQIKIDKMNHELEVWFQQQLRLIITHYDAREISDQGS